MQHGHVLRCPHGWQVHRLLRQRPHKVMHGRCRPGRSLGCEFDGELAEPRQRSPCSVGQSARPSTGGGGCGGEGGAALSRRHHQCCGPGDGDQGVLGLHRGGGEDAAHSIGTNGGADRCELDLARDRELDEVEEGDIDASFPGGMRDGGGSAFGASTKRR